MVKSRLKQAMVFLLLLFAVIGAIVVYKVMEERKKKNQFPPPPPPAASNVTVPPLELRGLQWLPPNCNIVVALQPGPLVVHAESKKQNPADAFNKFKFLPAILAGLAKAGLTLQDIDHLIAGAYVPDKDEELRLSVVLVLRGMRDEAKFLEGLKAKPVAGGYEATFDKFTVRMKKRSATEWCFGLVEKDFADGSSLSPAIREAVQKRVPESSSFWVAAAGEKWQEKPLVKLMGKDTADLSRWNGLAAGLSFGAEPKLTFALQAANGKWTSTERSPVDPFDLSAELKAILDSAVRK